MVADFWQTLANSTCFLSHLLTLFSAHLEFSILTSLDEKSYKYGTDSSAKPGFLKELKRCKIACLSLTRWDRLELLWNSCFIDTAWCICVEALCLNVHVYKQTLLFKINIQHLEVFYYVLVISYIFTYSVSFVCQCVWYYLVLKYLFYFVSPFVFVSLMYKVLLLPVDCLFGFCFSQSNKYFVH